METAPDLRIALETACDGSGGDITIDLTSVSFIDSSGISELVRPVNHGHRVVVTGASPTVRRTLLLAGLDEVLEVPDGGDDELAAGAR